MELSKFMKHKEREVVTLLTLILGGVRSLYSEVKIGEKVVAPQRFFVPKALHMSVFLKPLANSYVLRYA